jgi:hypothetical protein
MFALDAATLAALPAHVAPMDVAPATALRHDSHPHFKYKHRERQDCLHYCLPGPIDHWVAKLVDTLTVCEAYRRKNTKPTKKPTTTSKRKMKTKTKGKM